MPLTVGVERWRLAQPFKIARGVKTEAVTLTVRISERGADGAIRVGQGEATPYPHFGEDPESCADAVSALRGWIDAPSAGAPAERRARLQATLSPGAARNAVDCALWDLEAKLTGQPAPTLAGLTAPGAEDPVETAYTVSLDRPERMADAARAARTAGRGALLKLKLGAGGPADEIARINAVRAAVPKARLILDANEGWDLETLQAVDGPAAAAGALFIEQPLPAADDAALAGLALATPLCADESCHGPDDLDRVAERYGVVNLKLDKTGGFTAAIALREAALARGLGLMVGCMVSTSLAVAPAYWLCAGAVAVDLDGPLLLERDREPGLVYTGATMAPPEPALWG
ncbi:MAG: dipeptide epimerase [Pseudomonadota bacterium]